MVSDLTEVTSVGLVKALVDMEVYFSKVHESFEKTISQHSSNIDALSYHYISREILDLMLAVTIQYVVILKGLSDAETILDHINPILKRMNEVKRCNESLITSLPYMMKKPRAMWVMPLGAKLH